jgi:hypothetical protein
MTGQRKTSGDTSSKWASRGSQLWLQVLINRSPELLDQPIRDALKLHDGSVIEWVSPLEKDGFREYKDGDVLRRLGIEAKRRALSTFWPARGPVWDGLAKAGSQVVLVEAKAHIAELVSTGSKASPGSLKLITTSLQAVKKILSPSSQADWTASFYQYANRIAHLHFLRTENGIPAHLVFVYFVNATEVGGPATKEAWKGAVEVVECYLGLSRHRLKRYVHHVFVDVDELQTVAKPLGRPRLAARQGRTGLPGAWPLR